MGHRLLHGRDTFREGLHLPSARPGLGSHVHLEAWHQKGILACLEARAAALSQTYRWGRNTFYIKYLQLCSAEATGCAGRVNSGMCHGQCHC